jgi:hypothetical protein
MTWGFIWLMFILKIPIIGLFSIVWWAVKKTDEPADDVKVPAVPPAPDPHGDRPRRRVPRPRRPRGPHGDPLPLPPARVRAVTAIARETTHR